MAWPPLRYGVAVLSSAAALGLTLGLEPSLHETAGLLFFAAVAVSSWFGGRGPGLLAAALAVLALDYYFVPPLYTFGPPNLGALLRVLVFLGMSLTISWLSLRRKRAEAAQAQLLAEVDAQRRHFQDVVEHAPAGIAVLRSPDFTIELINPAYQAIAPGKDMLGRSWSEVWPELADGVLPLLEEVVRTGKPFRAVDKPLQIRRAPAAPLEEASFTSTYVLMRVWRDATDAVLVLITETTEQVRAREKTRELADIAQRRAAELTSVLDNMVDAVFVCDVEGRVALANEAGIQLLGLARPEEARLTVEELGRQLRMRHPDGSPVPPEELPLARALAGEVVVLNDEIIRNPRTQQDIYLRINASPIREAGGMIVGAVAVARDITELTELDRLKDQFIAVAAHELKTPVTIMKGCAQVLLRTDEEPTPARRRMLDAIDRGADRIDRLVNELLDISLLQQGRLELQMERLDLPQLVEEVANRTAFTAPTHRIEVVSAAPVVVRGDRDRLEQVLANLLDNAVRFSPHGGTIRVEVARSDQEAVVSVRDAGVGIPREKQAHIFQRFYRAHSGTPHDYGGMGVGLYISHEIVSRHGGRMWFESEAGKGSTFSSSLPLEGRNGGS